MLTLSSLLLKRLDSWFPMNGKEVFLSFLKNEIQISQGGINKVTGDGLNYFISTSNSIQTFNYKIVKTLELLIYALHIWELFV